MSTKLIQFARSSFKGHVVFFQVFLAAPSVLLFSWLAYVRGTFTIKWCLWLLLVSSVSAVVTAMLFWTTTGRHRIEKRK
jgi:hypothetical protein